jgi:hypothetical protein
LGADRSVDRRDRLTRRLSWLQKKETGHYSAARAELGGRTLKTGQSRCFVGYKKHTLRLWWRAYADGVLLIPLVSWVTPANVSEGGLLVPSLRYCAQQWSWRPSIVVADMGYLAAPAKQRCREQWHVAVVTKLRADMKLVPPFAASNQTACVQGQPLEWLGYVARQDRHWFGVTDPTPLCTWCWQAAQCPRQFAHAPSEHETLLGLLPLSSRPAQRLLQQVRPWIEPAQSFEKNQLGLSQMFLNSLRLTWCVSLLADAAVLLRALALLRHPPRRELLAGLMPEQTLMKFGESTEPD